MTTSHTDWPVTRRAALAVLGAGGAALALGVTARPAAAQDAAAMAAHPLVGTWLGQGGATLSRLSADGSVMIAWSANFVNGAGEVVFQSPGLGVWEPVDGRSARFTAVAVYSDAAGTFTGTSTVDGYLEASEDGQGWTDDWTHGTKFTDRDAAGNVIGEFTGDASTPPVTAIRLKVWDSGVFAVATPAAGTPTT
jgi:hypothetical protein